MRRAGPCVYAGFLFLFALAISAPAAAQSFEVGGGYHWLRYSNDHENINLPKGWNAGVGLNLTNALAIVGRITSTKDTLDVDGDITLYNYSVGLRVSGGSSTVRPFGRVLFGNTKFSCEAGDCDQTHGNMQIGGGVTVWCTPVVGLEGGVDFVRIFTDSTSDPHLILASANIVFGLGTRR